MVGSSSDDDNYGGRRNVKLNRPIELVYTLLHAVDIRAAKIKRRLQPVAEILELGETMTITPAYISA